MAPSAPSREMTREFIPLPEERKPEDRKWKSWVRSCWSCGLFFAAQGARMDRLAA